MAGSNMISDVLSDAVAEIDRYLADDVFGYGRGEIYERIMRVRNEMELLRILLDTPPAPRHDVADVLAAAESTDDDGQA